MFQQDQLQAHKHVDAGHSHSIHDTNYYGTPANVDYSPNEYGNRIPNYGQTSTNSAVIGDPVTSTGGSIRYGNETRPVNMSMVWIIRFR